MKTCDAFGHWFPLIAISQMGIDDGVFFRCFPCLHPRNRKWTWKVSSATLCRLREEYELVEKGLVENGLVENKLVEAVVKSLYWRAKEKETACQRIH